MTQFQHTLLKTAYLLVLIATSATGFEVPDKINIAFENHCFSCHDVDSEKGNIRLDKLSSLPLNARLDLLNQTIEQLYIKQMPPPKKKQPSKAERQLMVAWVARELRKHDALKLEEKLRYPSYGNYIDHEKLFSGEVKQPSYTPARRWMVSPQIFMERVKDVFELEGRDRNRSLYGVTNPFILPDRSGVRDYDNSLLNGGHLLVMLPNADWISTKQIYQAQVKRGEIKKGEFADPKDRWVPKKTPEAIEAVIISDSAPTEKELVDAIHSQFELVLRRRPSPDEVSRYLALTRSAIDIAGNSEGVRQMLVSVLLESEFLYRVELGAGNPDQSGRKLLSAHEAAYAISYALGDRGPDAKLQQAAAEGKLSSKQDFKREVERLLADKLYYAGAVDPAIGGKNMRPYDTSHPKLIRFFREFFGYPGAAKIFKDFERADGYYLNPARGTLGTSGFLIKEADRVVDWYVKQDKNVFENLLTTEDFFVYHDKDNEAGQKIISEWKEVYAKLKDTDWKTDPEKVIEENTEFLKSKKTVRILGGRQAQEITRYMCFFEETLGKGRTPFTTPSFAHGYTYHHAVFYNLPPTPGIFRYNNMQKKNFERLGDTVFWDYQVEQPFKLTKRKGILTHPAWLIAHSANFHTDPIKRGRWIREKLLAGTVPDIPITVDAQIPEDHNLLLRERVEQVTQKGECWKCHQYMNPLGLPFEVFDDFGRYRVDEPLEYPEHLVQKATRHNGSNTYKTKPVSTLGELIGTNDPKLDGKVSDPFDLIDRLAKSDRVRQSIIRHAFRFFMGRNETLSDSQTLIDADNAYVESGGSFKSVVVSILCSDSFRFRK